MEECIKGEGTEGDRRLCPNALERDEKNRVENRERESPLSKNGQKKTDPATSEVGAEELC